MEEETLTVIPLEEVRRFVEDCFKAVGTTSENASTVATNLVEADYRGHYSHGINRLNLYIQDIMAKRCDPNAIPSIEKETVATALVNGNNGLGSVVGKYCMDLAIAKAKQVGIGMVSAYGSNHYGIAGMYTLQAIEHGCIGISGTNTSLVTVPTRSKTASLGTSPLSFGASAKNGDSFVLDMATSTVALGKDIVNVFYDIVYLAIDIYVPLKKFSATKCPVWFSRELKDTVIDKKKSHKRYLGAKC
ncbi:uncharacterized oxidoreductase YjmC-like [Cylas formicarius]|uniref:uncharacterized oxidoreductase YjmC-like n=1 Tax=Cylas formicarius TaxID=197179 RepID=UPI0029588229|nr:uncharacterized oxidoreductase YjmC-like [Cylas formicarius]